jgi:hypothetical protein
MKLHSTPTLLYSCLFLATITENDISIIKHARKSLLFGNGKLLQTIQETQWRSIVHQHQALQENYLRLSTNVLHFSHRTNKHLRNLRLFTRIPLDIVTLTTRIYVHSGSLHRNGHVGIGNATYPVIWFNPPFSKSVNTNI